MTQPGLDPTAERLAAALLAGFFALFGWFTLWQGGITLKGRSGATSFVSGAAGQAVAALALAVAGFGIALFLRSFRVPRPVRLLAFALLLGPALLLVFWRH
jgi:hypothetical protein